MEPGPHHPYPPAASFDGGDLDCGSGLLLLIRRHIDPLAPGQLLEIRSTDASVREDLPSWCRLTRNELVSHVRSGTQDSYLVCKGPFSPAQHRTPAPITQPLREVVIPKALPAPAPAPPLSPLSVMGIGSWPRPRWLLQSLHERLEGRLSEDEFQDTANDAVRLAVAAQLDAGVDVLTDGEQRRDNYASFVAGILDNCQLIPITDLLPYVDDPIAFEAELRALDVPADKVRHPAVFGKLGRSRPLALGELLFARTLADVPIKVALPGPYLLTRTMWMECISDRAYETRESLADDIVRVLREEVHFLLAGGAAMVQLDEPVLSEVVAGLPRDRLALHICRGNWTRDESVALSGDYVPLVPLLSRVRVGTLFLELCTRTAPSPPRRWRRRSSAPSPRSRAPCVTATAFRLRSAEAYGGRTRSMIVLSGALHRHP